MSNFVLTEERWRELLVRDDFACRNCNSQEQLQPAHVIARSKLGTDDLSNLILLCFTCHRKHHDGKLIIQNIKGNFFLREVR